MSMQEKLVMELAAVFGDKLKVTVACAEVTAEVLSESYLAVCQILHNHANFKFDILIDLAGVDYSDYADGSYSGARFAVVLHLLSIEHNSRLRLKVFTASDSFPVIDSVTSIWSAADWYEREAFDMFGLIFEGHNDLRRILTDYGFIGHPLRKDFPVTGHVEMRYDPEQKRVIYQPVTIDPREVTPRVIREEGYGKVR